MPPVVVPGGAETSIAMSAAPPERESRLDEAERWAADGWRRALELTSGIDVDPHRTLPVLIEELADRFGEATALFSEDERLSFAGLAGRSSRYARWALDQGLAVGDVACLLMPNRPEYLAAWLGITRIGGVVALLNTHLVGPSLAHTITIADPRYMIVAAELVDAFETAVPHLASSPEVWVHGPRSAGDLDRVRARRLDPELQRYDDRKLTGSERRSVSLSDRALLIYTSGTTGLPKAANVSHRRVMMWSHWFAGMLRTGPTDRMYNCLPMYHSIGGIVATGCVLVTGGSVAIRERFSTSRFWDDVVRWECTLFQYIGELCRYLVRAPRCESERRHKLRVCCGNGLQSDVWSDFQERFGIRQIVEFYAATEGNFSLYNLEGRPGSIGRIPPFLTHRSPAALVKFDPETGVPLRDAQGLCIRCGRNEVGEAIGKIAGSGRQIGAPFEGYTTSSDSEKKVLRDVFVPGDAWFRTGDLMRQDERGYFYFVDRVGDTFRWKGENIATTEVAAAVSSCPGVIDATVYGVPVPGADGRAGMAALVVDPSFDPPILHAHLANRLPDYARPRFLRLCESIELTETFKQKKQDLAQEGFDPSRMADLLYFDDPRGKAYVRLDPSLFELIESGAVRI